MLQTVLVVRVTWRFIHVLLSYSHVARVAMNPFSKDDHPCRPILADRSRFFFILWNSTQRCPHPTIYYHGSQSRTKHLGPASGCQLAAAGRTNKTNMYRLRVRQTQLKPRDGATRRYFYPQPMTRNHNLNSICIARWARSLVHLR